MFLEIPIITIIVEFEHGVQIQNIRQQVNFNIFPVKYGTEDLSHTLKFSGDFMKDFIKQTDPTKSIPELFEQIHRDESLPEFHNVFTSSERSSYALVSDGTTFRNKPKKTVIDQIIEDKRSLIYMYVDKNGDKLGDKVLKKYTAYGEHLDDKDVQEQLQLEIGGLLLDMKSVIANDDKTRRLLEKVDEGHFDSVDDDTDTNPSVGTYASPIIETSQE